MRKKVFLSDIQIPLFLLLLCIVAYLPLSSFQFGLKNDAFIFNFPAKHFFSESIHASVLPTWNPYLNFGFPLYADPGFAWWQPITWIFGIAGYNVYTFTIELLFYIYLAGLGMYWLSIKLNLSKATGTVLAIMFMCSGFFVGNLQHINFITCSAFLPWLVGAWIVYQNKPHLKNLLGCGIAAYLLSTGGHPAIPIATVFFFFILTIFYPLFKRSENFKDYIFNQLKLVAVIIIFLLPLIISYSILLPYYSRVGSVNQQQHSITGFSLPSFISFLYPFATIKNPKWYNTDVSMRNGYFSIAGIIFFLLFLIRRNKNYLQRTLLVAGIILLFLSLGGNVKVLLYEDFPVFSWIKTNGEFRVFAIFSFIFCAGFEIESFMAGENGNLFRKITMVILFISIALVGWLVVSGLGKFSFAGSSSTDKMKYFIDNISFHQSLLIAAVVTTIFCLGYLLILNKNKSNFWLVSLISAEMIVNSWLLLPVTGVSKTSVSQLEAMISKYPKGFPYRSTNEPETINQDEEKMIGDANWYNKKIVHSRIEYPSLLKSSEHFYRSADTAAILNKPFAFLKNANREIKPVAFLPKGFEFDIASSTADTLIVLQNYFPGWRAEADGRKIEIEKNSDSFLAIPILSTTKNVKLGFHAFRFN